MQLAAAVGLLEVDPAEVLALRRPRRGDRDLERDLLTRPHVCGLREHLDRGSRRGHGARLEDEIPVRDVRGRPRRRDLTGHPRGVHRGRVEVDARQRRPRGRDVVRRGLVEGQAGIARLRQVDAAAADVERVGRRDAVRLGHAGELRGRLEGRLDLARRPGGVKRGDERGGAGHVRCRHRRARDRLEQVAGRPAVRRFRRRRIGREDVESGSGDVGLQPVPSRAARREVGDAVALPGRRRALREGRRGARVRRQEGEELLALGRGDVDGRKPVVVRHHVERRRVVEDHPRGAALSDVEAADDAAGAPLAGDDLAGEEPGRRRRGAADVVVGRGGARGRPAAGSRCRR